MRQVLINGCLVRGCDTPGCQSRWPCETHGTQSVQAREVPQGGPKIPRRACRDCGYHVCSCDAATCERWSTEWLDRALEETFPSKHNPPMDEVESWYEAVRRMEGQVARFRDSLVAGEGLRPEEGWQSYVGNTMESKGASRIVRRYPDHLAAVPVVESNGQLEDYGGPRWREGAEWVRRHSRGGVTGAQHRTPDGATLGAFQVHHWRIVEKPADV